MSAYKLYSKLSDHETVLELWGAGVRNILIANFSFLILLRVASLTLRNRLSLGFLNVLVN